VTWGFGHLHNAQQFFGLTLPTQALFTTQQAAVLLWRPMEVLLGGKIKAAMQGMSLNQVPHYDHFER